MSPAAKDEPVDESYPQWRFSLPPGATDVLIVRHGTSMPARFDAPAEMIEGQADPDLAPEGWDQAARVADRLADDDIAAIYTSTLRRTVQTAGPLASRLGLESTAVADLREIGLGEWEGAAFRKYTSEGHPLAVRMFTEQRWDIIPGAESNEDFAARIRRGVTTAAQAHRDQRIVLVVHGGVIGMMFAIATGASTFAFTAADNASISELVVQDERWMPRRFNDTAHLTDLVRGATR